MPFLFLFIIIIFFNLLAIIETEDCEIYNDCFNCSVCGEDSSNSCNCNWSTNSKICQDFSPRTLNSYFYHYFTYCIDDDSKTITNTYCGQTTLELNDKNEVSVTIPKVNEKYGASNLYCEYKYTAMDNKNTYYTINYHPNSDVNSQFQIFLEITYFDETMTSGYLIKDLLEKEFYNIKELKLLLYFKDNLSSSPFTFTMTKNGGKSKLVLYLTIGIIIIACILCSLLIYFISKKLSLNEAMRQRQILERAMDRQRRAYIIREEIASSGSEEVNIEEENKKKIDFLLKSTLAPKKFNKKYGEKDGLTCTICIENFKVGKSKVCVTPCQHVFHYKCLSNWLVKNFLNPKCPNCNYNLIKDVNIPKNEEIETINVKKKDNPETLNSEAERTNNINNINYNENIVISRNGNNRPNRRRIVMNNNVIATTSNNNLTENNPNSNGAEEVVIENI